MKKKVHLPPTIKDSSDSNANPTLSTSTTVHQLCATMHSQIM